MAVPRQAHARGPVLCEYFVTCQRVAGGTAVDPVVGIVPVCPECALLPGVDRIPDTGPAAVAAAEGSARTVRER